MVEALLNTVANSLAQVMVKKLSDTLGDVDC